MCTCGAVFKSDVLEVGSLYKHSAIFAFVISPPISGSRPLFVTQEIMCSFSVRDGCLTGVINVLRLAIMIFLVVFIRKILPISPPGFLRYFTSLYLKNVLLSIHFKISFDII